MIPISWLKKIWKGRSKGISTVLGTVFLTLVVFAISTNVFLWTLSRNAEYTQAVKEENQKNIDRLSENVIASHANYSVSGNKITIKVTVKNAGSVAAQIIKLWVFDTSQQKYAYKSFILNLNPGHVEELRGLKSLQIQIDGASNSSDFVSWFVTARGNTVPLETLQEVILAQVAQGIGSISMDFPTFRSFQYNINDTLKDYPNGTLSYSVPYDTSIAFGVVLTNLDPSREPIHLDKYSQLWLDFPAVPGVPPFAWYIISETNGIIDTSYSEVSILYAETKLIIFASAEPGSFSSLSKVKISHGQLKEIELGAVNLLLHGIIGDSDYGQNIPFVSLSCHPISG